MRIAIVLALAWFVSLLSGCRAGAPMHDGAMSAHHDAMHSSTAPQPSESEVETLQVAIENFAFQPSHIKVHAGDTVTWTNRDSAPHTVTFENAPFKSGLLAQNESWSNTFAQIGTFPYFCEPHPWMKGQVTVEEE